MQKNNKNNYTPQDNKKILCINILQNKRCNYGNKCVYAHNLSDQKIDIIRHKAYTIIKSNNDLQHINLLKDDELFNNLLKLTKVCSLCYKKICPGGYNCKYGAINYNCTVCYSDIMFGFCKRSNCYSVHLTKRGLIPRATQLKLERYKNRDDEYDQELNNITGTLLTEEFILSHFNKTDEKLQQESESDEENVDDVIRYLNGIEEEELDISVEELESDDDTIN
jgi:hypothetical protein